MTTLETRANSKADSSETTTGPVVTLDQVKDALAKVAAHPLCSEKMANRFAINSGGAVRGDNWDSIQPKKFERVLRKCESAIKEADEAEHLIEITAQRKDDLDVVGKQITSLADKIKREAEAELKHKAEGNSFFQHLTEKLKEAEPLAKAAGMTMKALKLKYVGDRLGDTRFKLALRIARGLITHQQATAADTKVTREKRAAAKPPASDTVVRGADGKPLDTSGFVGAAKLQLAAELAKAAAEPGGRRNGVYVKSHDPKRTANMTRITKAIHKAEASGDAAALAVAVAEREAADMIFRETFTKGSETFTVTSLNYENDFSDKATNGCLTREEIAENERAHGVGFGGVTMSKYPAEPEAVEVQTESPEEISSRPEPPRVLSAEEKSDDALTAFKVACQTHCPVMSDADLKAARLYVQGKDGNGQGTWRPRNATIKKAA